MQKKLLPSLAAAVIGAGLLVGASFAGSAGSASPAKAGSAEAKRGGTLRVNLSTTDYEFLDPALSYEAPGWGVLFMTNLMLLNYPDKPAPEGSRLVAGRSRLPPRLARRADLHVHDQARPPLQRRLGGHGGGVQAGVRTGRRTSSRPRRRSPSCTTSSAQTPAPRARRARSRASSRTVRRSRSASPGRTRPSWPRSRCRSSRR